MKKFAVLLMLLCVSLFSLSMIGCSGGDEPATGGGGTPAVTPADEGSGEPAMGGAEDEGEEDEEEEEE